MSQWLDQLKLNMQQQLSKVYKDAKRQASADEWILFESWFWKIRPNLNVDLAKYNPPSSSETTGPNAPENKDSSVINKDKKELPQEI